MENRSYETYAGSDIRESVKSLYSKAATAPQPGLCCPQDYAAEWRKHIPNEAFEFNYGCGSPVLKAGIKANDVVVDLGSGVGIDCFVAAKLVGAKGKVIGIDMTDEMLDKAGRYAQAVSKNIGYNVIEFRKGHIEEIPVDNGTANVVVSNCVLNLSPDKQKVFAEIQRVLADGGKIVISDVVSDIEVPEQARQDKKLWSECYTGALSVGEFIRALGTAGFTGLTIVDEKPWTDIDGVRYASVTVEGYKFSKGKTCAYQGHRAVYLGPYAMVMDEEGHQFPRFKDVEVCTDTAGRLAKGPYASSFTIIEPATAAKQADGACCAPAENTEAGASNEKAGGACCTTSCGCG